MYQKVTVHQQIMICILTEIFNAKLTKNNRSLFVTLKNALIFITLFCNFTQNNRN